MDSMVIGMKDKLGIEFLSENRENSCIDEILKTFDSEYWELNEQEYSWLNAHEQKTWKKYLEFRRKFRYDANEEKMSDFPIYMIIEPSSICNLECIMCFQRDERLKQKSGIMDISLWKKAIDEASKKGCCALTIAGRGEPLINKNIVEMLDYSKDKFLEIKLNTNGLLMNDDIIRSILRNDINVVFSAEGSNEMEYSSIRKGGKFHELVANIKRFSEIRKREFQGSLSRTRVSGVGFNTIDVERYYNFWEPLVDEVAITTYEERKDTYNNDRNSKKVKTVRCARLWQRIYVWWDGLVSPCDVDYLNALAIGNINDESIEKIWNGDLLRKLRAQHQEGRRNQVIPCDRCESTDI